MIATSLLEALTALALCASLLASLTTTATIAAVLGSDAARVHGRLARLRRIEHLLDGALSHPVLPQGRVTPVAVAQPSRVVLEADHDGDGRLETGSGERTAFEVRAGPGDIPRLVHRLGRQAMGICNLEPQARIEYFDSFGAATTDVAEVRMLSLPTPAGALLAALPPPWR